MYDEIIEDLINSMTIENAAQIVNYLREIGIQNIQEISIESETQIRYGSNVFTNVGDLKQEITDGIFSAEQDATMALYQTVLIGTEFTFNQRDDSNRWIFGMEDLSGRNRKVEEAGHVLDMFTQDIKNNTRMQSHNIRCNSIEIQRGTKKHEHGSYNAVKIIFDLYDNKTGVRNHWFVNFDLDPCCIELQTQPVPYDFFETYKNFLQNAIFEAAERIGLTADQDPHTGGGGHISLDYRTAFCNNAFFLRNFMVLYNNEIRNPQRVHELLELVRECSDVDNAPFLSEIGEIDQFIDLVSRDNFQSPSFTTNDFVNAMHTHVYTNMTEGLRRMKDSKGKQLIKQEDIPHYQAINLEHLLNEDERLRRVELRRFNAQRSIGELLDELNIIFKLLLYARVLSPIQPLRI